MLGERLSRLGLVCRDKSDLDQLSAEPLGQGLQPRHKIRVGLAATRLEVLHQADEVFPELLGRRLADECRHSPDTVQMVLELNIPAGRLLSPSLAILIG